jgi:hypothetical protein
MGYEEGEKAQCEWEEIKHKKKDQREICKVTKP